MTRISAVIITHNEERNIGRCLESLAGVADEVVVVDSGSTDRTEAICLQHGARFEHHPWEGYAEQKNYADRLATGDWILSIDADEALSPALRESLTKLKATGPDRRCLYGFNRLSNYCGHWIKHSGWYPDRCNRLWPNDGSVRWDGIVHETLSTPPMKHILVGGDLWHYSYYTVGEHAARTVKYALMAGEKAYLQGRRCRAGIIGLKSAWTFLRTYFLQLGFLDGHAGFTVCKVSAFYTFVKYSRLHELTTGCGNELSHETVD